MGTMLMKAGLEAGDSPEKWNVTHPEVIQEIHRGYIEAGSQIILTNSFGGNRFRLALHRLDDRADEFNKAAAANARTEADKASHLVVVAGSMGPTGQLLQPLGTVSFEDAQSAFAEQAASLAEGGVDMFWIETMSDLEEVRAAVQGIRSVSDLPISATMSFDTNGHTMMGVSPAKAVEVLGGLDLVSVGANCGTGPDKLQEAVKMMREVNPNVILAAKANAGIPKLVGNQDVYDGTPQVMAKYATDVREIGATLIGGCCGNTPEHIRAMAKVLRYNNGISVSKNMEE
ncbi:MAG: methionine synthase I [Anaerolineaceae bacterium 4572_5.1]|nr:MAG: methionine synthase I [Anaerolineaceae bacterium 4572_5.1]